MSAATSESGSDGTQPSRRLKYRLIAERHAICKLRPDAPIPEWALQPGPVCSITRTADELSIVCHENNISASVRNTPELRDRPPSTGWICLKLEGPFPFTETGILESFLKPLSANSIPIFAVSTFDTDYVFIPEQFWGAAHDVLSAAGHEFLGG